MAKITFEVMSYDQRPLRETLIAVDSLKALLSWAEVKCIL